MINSRLVRFSSEIEYIAILMFVDVDDVISIELRFSWDNIDDKSRVVTIYKSASFDVGLFRWGRFIPAAPAAPGVICDTYFHKNYLELDFYSYVNENTSLDFIDFLFSSIVQTTNKSKTNDQ